MNKLSVKCYWISLVITIGLNADFSTTIVTPTLLTAASFPVTIATPGVYWLTQNATHAPGATGTSAITITASNVTLDLKGFSITQTNSTANTHGITAVGTLTDIVIRNGSCASFTGDGVRVSTTGGLGVSSERIKILNLIIQNCITSGINLIGLASPNQIKNVTIDKCTVSECCTSTAASTISTALSCTNINQLRLRNTAVVKNGTASLPSTSTVYGVALTTCTNAYLNNINLGTNLGGGGFFVGIFLSSCNSVRLTDCAVNNNTGTLNTRSYDITGSMYTYCTNCVALNNSFTNSVEGFFVDSKTVLRNCSVSGSQSDARVRGINFTGTDNLAVDCVCQENAGTTGVNQYVFNIERAATRCGLVRCISNNNTVNRAYNFFGDVTGPTNSVAIDCISASDRGATGSAGFRYQSATGVFGVTTLRCVAQGTTTPYLNFPAGSTQSATNISNINGSLTNSWTNISVN